MHQRMIMFNANFSYGLPILIWFTTFYTSTSIASPAYNQIPPLYTTDDYQECLQQSAASYCMVYVEIQPDNNSLVWQQILNIQNSYQYHYRHDLLYRGICTSTYETYPESQNFSLSDVTAIQPNSENVHMGRKLHEISQNQKSISQNEYQLQAYVNGAMEREYNVSVKTFVTYCDNPNEPIEKGYPFWLAAVILIVIGLLNIFSTFYDYYLKSKIIAKKSDITHEYFDTNHKYQVNKYLTAFSLYRNYRRLVVPNNSAIGKDFRFIDGFRTILSIVIVLEHVTITHCMQLSNPEYFENLFATRFLHMFLHISNVIELFFLLSGLMLYVKFDRSKYVTSKSTFMECITIYIRMIFSRYLRYMPSVLLLILFSSQILIHLQKTPYWRHIMEPSVVMCRNDWWSNVLMITNSRLNRQCWVHTWYISADFQLYAFFLLVLIIVARYPKSKKIVYTIVGSLGLLLPSIINYVKKLNSSSTVFTENFRHMYLKDVETIQYLYLASYTSLNGFFIGLVCGELYMRYLRHDKHKQTMGRYLKRSPLFGWLAILGIWYLGSFLIVTRDHSVWKSLFVMAHKNISVAIVATIVVLWNMCHGGGFLAKPFFRLLARISYQVYLWHFIILYVIYANFQQPFEVSSLFLTALFFSTYILAVIASFLIAIMVEYPMAELLSVFDLKKK